MPVLRYDPLQNTFASSTDLKILPDVGSDLDIHTDVLGREKKRFVTEVDNYIKTKASGAGASVTSSPLLWRVELGADEALFVPAGFPHQVQNLEPSIALAGNYIDDTNAALALAALRAEGGAEGANDGSAEASGEGSVGNGRCSALIRALARFTAEQGEWKWDGSGDDQRRFMSWAEFKRGRSALQPFNFDPVAAPDIKTAAAGAGAGAGNDADAGADADALTFVGRPSSAKRLVRAAKAAMGQEGSPKKKVLLLLGANPPACPGCVLLARLLRGDRDGNDEPSVSANVAALRALVAREYTVLLVNMELASDRQVLQQNMPALIDQWKNMKAALLVVVDVDVQGGGFQYRPEAASDLRNLVPKRQDGGEAGAAQAKTSCSAKLPHMCFALGADERPADTFDLAAVGHFLTRK
jgi:hypothetical protein